MIAIRWIIETLIVPVWLFSDLFVEFRQWRRVRRLSRRLTVRENAAERRDAFYKEWVVPRMKHVKEGITGSPDGSYLMPHRLPVKKPRRGFGLLFRLFGWPYHIEYVNTVQFFRETLATMEVQREKTP